MRLRVKERRVETRITTFVTLETVPDDQAPSEDGGVEFLVRSLEPGQEIHLTLDGDVPIPEVSFGYRLDNVVHPGGVVMEITRIKPPPALPYRLL